MPFFILAGNFLTHGGVARRMINFATAMVGHWYGWLGARRRARMCAVRGGVRFVAGDGSRHRLDHTSRDGGAGLSRSASVPASSPHPARLEFCSAVIIPSWYAVATSGMQPRGYAVATNSPRSESCSLPALSLASAGHDARRDDLLSGLAQRLSAHEKGASWPSAWRDLPRKRSGACC